ncbi:hypothetical protein PV325_006627 [Microctonus aethiopoides]|nr:hypothetical protein PV325_006627 [Microctonus aethiopoides]KAK0093595.1 hypothetical protein PV326_013144 [Microctonus aethiopoides]
MFTESCLFDIRNYIVMVESKTFCKSPCLHKQKGTSYCKTAISGVPKLLYFSNTSFDRIQNSLNEKLQSELASLVPMFWSLLTHKTPEKQLVKGQQHFSGLGLKEHLNSLIPPDSTIFIIVIDSTANQEKANGRMEPDCFNFESALKIDWPRQQSGADCFEATATILVQSLMEREHYFSGSAISESALF